MKHFLKLVLVLLSGSLLLAACEESACNTSTRTALQLKFYSITTSDSIPRDTVITRDIEGIYGIGREDSVMYVGASTNTVSLPLPLEGDTCQFVIDYPGNSDTLTLAISRQLRYISKGCGFVTWFTLLNASVTGEAAVRVQMIEPSVRNSNDENIRLYY